MPASYIKLTAPAFGKAKDVVLAVDLSDSRAAALVNAGLAVVVPNPGGAPPSLPAPTSAAVNQVVGDPALLVAVQAALLAAHDTDAEREAFVPARLSPAALGAAFGSAHTALKPRQMMPAQRRTMLSAFQTGHGWTGNGVGTINLNDTSDYGLGSQHVSITTSGGGNVGGQRSEITKTFTAFDMTAKAIALLVRVDSITNLDQLRIAVGTDASNYFLVSAFFGPAQAQNNRVQLGEWAWLTIDLSAAPATIGTPTKTACTYVMLRVTDLGGGASAKATVHIGGIALVDKPVAAAPNGVVTFGFDDGYADQFDNARPILDRYGYGATAYIIQDLIGATPATYMSLSQLHQLEDRHGWEMAAHSATIADHNATGAFTSLTPTQLRANLEQHKTWLLDNNFRGADHFAYPQGFWNAATRDITRDYFTTVRLVAPGFEVIPPSVPLSVTTQPINAGTALATLTALVDKAKSERSWLIFYTHRVLPSGAAGTQIDTATFSGFVDYVAAQGLTVRNMTDALKLAA
jgi:peptidoglycan/xylan/chitin deacetylase (PgdA/CDA1 family)